MWRSLIRRMLCRTPGLDPQSRAFGYVGAIQPMLVTLICVSAIEVVVVDLIIRRTVSWPPLRITMLALGVYGVIWMLGLFAGARIHPHVAGPAGLRIRNGATIDVTVDWDAVASVRHRHRSLASGRGVQAERTGDDLVLALPTGGRTSIDVLLRRPTLVAVPKGPDDPVTELRFYADDPDALVACARSHLAA